MDMEKNTKEGEMLLHWKVHKSYLRHAIDFPIFLVPFLLPETESV